jgi:hypothetical protein
LAALASGLFRGATVFARAGLIAFFMNRSFAFGFPAAQAGASQPPGSLIIEAWSIDEAPR